MKILIPVFLLLAATLVRGNIPATDMPFAPQEAAVVERLIEREQVEVVAKPGAPPGVVTRSLGWLDDSELDLSGLSNLLIHLAANTRVALNVTYTPEGHIVALSGNGPWIHNDSLREFVHLPELRMIWVDHNSRHHREPERGHHYRGEGFAALADSKIAILRLTSGPDDNGLAAIKQLKNLQWFEIFHAPMSADGIEAHLLHHPTIRRFRLGKMGTVAADILKIPATMPNLKELYFAEAYVTYANGLDYLKPLAGQLEIIDLSKSLIAQADLARLKADHPGAEILYSTPEEVGNGHRGVANRLSKLELPAELGEPLRAAIEARKR